MAEWFIQPVVAWLQRYGHVALFVFIVLETAWILHFVPSEVVIPATAAVMVSSPTSFAVFVGVSTVGAVIGSLLAYYLFGVYGEAVIRRYGDWLHIREAEIERSRAWFRRWGEHSVLWGRLVPVFRTPVSIPAGYAGMNRPKFVAYSAIGWLAYNAALVGLVYAEDDTRAPIDLIVAAGVRAVGAIGVLPAGMTVLAAAVAVVLVLARRGRVWG